MNSETIQEEAKCEAVLEQFEDPLRMMILIEMLRKLDITANQPKKQLVISGSKIYYYLTQLTTYKSPLIFESETEKVTEHLIRPKFKVTEDFNQLLAKHFDLKKNSRQYLLSSLYMSIAIQYLQIRELKDSHSKAKDNGELPYPLLMFVDEEIAKELRDGINQIFDKCWNRYKGADWFDALQVCVYGAIAGIYKMS